MDVSGHDIRLMNMSDVSRFSKLLEKLSARCGAIKFPAKGLMKKPPALQVEEIGGDQYPDLDAAQRAALPGVASDLAETIRRLLAEGWLINDNGRIIPNPERIQRK
jgi:hypothetical protein